MLQFEQSDHHKKIVDEAFEVNDIFGDGQLTINEFVNVIISFMKTRLAGDPDFEDYIRNLSDSSDLNLGNFENLDDEEMKKRLTSMRDGKDRSFLELRARMLFESADKDGDGLLSDPEVGRLILRLPILYMFAKPENQEDMIAFFDDMVGNNDVDGNGLDIDEFFTFMIKTYVILTRTLDAAVKKDSSFSILIPGLGWGIFPDYVVDQMADYYN